MAVPLSELLYEWDLSGQLDAKGFVTNGSNAIFALASSMLELWHPLSVETHARAI